MFDTFATILSAGVVISVVTLVVHEPLLLAAGITTLLGLMFLMLPVFVAMVPALGYLLVFTGLVLLGYGVLSTRSWLNTLHARRAAALARRRTLYSARTKDEDDSDLRRAGQMAGLAAPPSSQAVESGAGRGNSAQAQPAAREPMLPMAPSQPESRAGGALGRVGRGLDRDPGSRGANERSASKPGPGNRERDEDEFERMLSPRPQPAPSPVVVAAPPPPPPPPSPLPVKPAALVSVPAKPLSRGAERIERIKAESRGATRRSAPARLKPVQQEPSQPPVALPPVVAAVPAAAPADDRVRRRAQDLLELGLLDVEADDGENQTSKAVAQKSAKPFVSRLARRG